MLLFKTGIIQTYYLDHNYFKFKFDIYILNKIGAHI